MKLGIPMDAARLSVSGGIDINSLQRSFFGSTRGHNYLRLWSDHLEPLNVFRNLLFR